MSELDDQLNQFAPVVDRLRAAVNHWRSTGTSVLYDFLLHSL
jgi:hypothetical protein